MVIDTFLGEDLETWIEIKAAIYTNFLSIDSFLSFMRDHTSEDHLKNRVHFLQSTINRAKDVLEGRV